MKTKVDPRILAEIWDVICSRAENPTPDSYTSRLLNDKKGIDKVLEKVTKLGGKIGVPKKDIPGVGVIAVIQDTEGNAIGLWKPSMDMMKKGMK